MLYQSRKRKKKSKFFVLLFWFLFLLVIGIFYFIGASYNSKIFYQPGTRIEISKWETFSKFYSHLSGFQKIMMKFWMRNHSRDLPKLQEWIYHLSGSYSKLELMNFIAQWPELSHTKLTFLEWWSIYDIDQYLTKNNFFKAGVYLQKVQDQQFIEKMRSEFSFLALLPEGKSLEGFLYPDTYFLDQQWNSIEKVIKMQLENFDNKVWKKYRDQFITFTPQGLDLTNYRALILASVIENEEKNQTNKPLIAGIFINRLLAGMRLDADVTLCYWLKLPYSQCRDAIPSNLSDATNLYNTRQNIGLMPTPISSPSIATLDALFNYQETDALFYLHDNQGKIYYGVTLEEHNQNKLKYLK